MRKTAVWIIIAVVLLICGAVIFVVAGSMVGWDLRMLGTGKYETNTYDIAEKFENITIDADISDVRFVPTRDGSCRVVCVENEKIKHSVSVKDGTLWVECEDDRKWTDRISFFGFDGPSITVHLPGGKYSSLSVHTLAGDITICYDFSFDSALIKCTTV